MFQLLHRWIWQDPERCARKLLTFAETEADGGRDLIRAAELTRDPLLRRLFICQASDIDPMFDCRPYARAERTDVLRSRTIGKYLETVIIMQLKELCHKIAYGMVPEIGGNIANPKPSSVNSY